MWGAAIGGASSIIGNWIGSRQNRKNVHDTNKANREMAEYSFGQNRKMAEYSYDKNLEQWHRQNKYNDPKAQMSRFKDAGLNPHLIYGQGSPGNATGSPQHSPAQHSPAKQDYTGRTNPVAMSLLDVAQARLLNAQASQLESQSGSTNETTINQKIQNQILEATKDAKTEQAKNEAQISTYNSWIKHIESTQKSFGIDNAETMYKILFQHMNQDTKLSPSDMHKVLSGITITKEISNVLKNLGLGAILSNFSKKPNQNFFFNKK